MAFDKFVEREYKTCMTSEPNEGKHMFTVYNTDGTKRTQWTSKANAVAAGRALKKAGETTYVVNESNAEIVWQAGRN